MVSIAAFQAVGVGLILGHHRWISFLKHLKRYIVGNSGDEVTCLCQHSASEIHSVFSVNRLGWIVGSTKLGVTWRPQVRFCLVPTVFFF